MPSMRVGFPPDGARAVTGSYDNTLKLWSVRDGKEIATMTAVTATRCSRIAVSAEDGTIASGSDDGEIRLWDGRTGRFLRTLANQGGYVGALSFSPDGKRLLSTCGYEAATTPSASGTWRPASSVWPTPSTITSCSRRGRQPDGRLVATGGGNNSEIHIWDMKTGEGTKPCWPARAQPRWAAALLRRRAAIGLGQHLAERHLQRAGPLELAAALARRQAAAWVGPSGSTARQRQRFRARARRRRRLRAVASQGRRLRL